MERLEMKNKNEYSLLNFNKPGIKSPIGEQKGFASSKNNYRLRANSS